MGRPLLTRKTVLAAKIESTAYTYEALGAQDSNYNVFGVDYTPNIEQEERMAADGFSNRASTTGLRSGQISFKCDLHGDGGGGVPTWASTFLPACAIVDTGGGVFACKTGTPFEGTLPDNGIRTLTMAVFEDGRRKSLTGAMGTARFVFPTGKNAYVEFTFKGSWNDVEDATVLTPSYPDQFPLRFASANLTINAIEPCVAEISVDIGNTVSMRECQKNANASGYRGAFVGNRKVIGSLDPEAQLVADYDFYGDWINSNERAMLLRVQDDNDRIQIDVPKFQITNVGNGDRNGLRTDPVTWQANRNAAADDEITITFGAPV